MKKILIFILIFSNSLYTAKLKKVLFIGNSYTYTSNMPQIVVDLAVNAGYDLTFDMSAPPGYSLVIIQTILQH